MKIIKIGFSKKATMEIFAWDQILIGKASNKMMGTHCLASLTWTKKSSLSADHYSTQIYAKTN